MESDAQIEVVLAVILGITLMFLGMAFLLRWARKRGTGAIATGALLSVLAPDPTLERNVRLVEEARELHGGEVDNGEGKD